MLQRSILHPVTEVKPVKVPSQQHFSPPERQHNTAAWEAATAGAVHRLPA